MCSMPEARVEIVPAILRKTYEAIAADWKKVQHLSPHIQLDITDGVFAGEGTYRQIRRFKQLPESQKIELHMMVHTPANFVDDIIDLNPARCIFHLESFAGTPDIEFVYEKLREATQCELALAMNPASPNERLEDHLGLVHYVMFMGYNPGWANQPLDPMVFTKIGQFKDKHPKIPIAADGHVTVATTPDYVKAGAHILCANTAIFAGGSPGEHYERLQLAADSALDRS